MPLAAAWLGIVVCALLAPLAGCEKKPESTGATGATGAAPKLIVVAETPDIGAIASAVGGDRVEVTSLVKGPDDPHNIQVTTAGVELLAKANLLIVISYDEDDDGHDDHHGLPSMVKASKSSRIMPKGDGYLNLEHGVRTLVGPESRGVPGSFHPYDNPHYLSDPVEGVKAARAIAEKLSQLSPADAEYFRRNYRALAAAVMAQTLGEDLAAELRPEQFEEVCIAIEHDKLEDFLKENKLPVKPLGGDLAKFKKLGARPVVGDHDLWPYFSRRYAINVIGYVEPQPGVAPTAPHVAELAKKMKEADCKVIMISPYFDARHTTLLAKEAGAKVVPMAHQPGGQPGTESYADFIAYNARALLEAFDGLQGK
jgi:ABC-type Zn uptake system ZnuABC Zn-binding protein ZnuA